MTREEAVYKLKSAFTMCEFIDAYGEPIDSDIYYEALEVAIEALQQPEIIRCKNCKYWNRLTIVTSKDERKGLCEHHDHIMATREDFFCADGEEKDDETTADRHEHV